MKLKKSVLLLAASICLISAIAGPVVTFALGNDWDISSFQAEEKINKDASVIIKETIVADYSREAHHGIIRNLPINYRDNYGQNFNLRVKVLSLTDENNKPWNYVKSTEGEYLVLKVGDADILLNKPSTFIITYQIERAVLYHENKDEFYWNITGTEWDVPIKKASAIITLPEGIDPKNVNAICFTGPYGSREQECKTEIQGNTVTISATRGFSAYDGLTGSVEFPSGIIQKPSVLQQILWTLQDNWGYALPFVVFGILFYLWYTRGRDPRTGRETIMPIYTPPNKLTPGEIGTIIDESVDIRDITSGIIDMAVRGYIKIIEIKEKILFFNSTDYEFKKLKEFENDGSLKSHEITLLKGIFGSADSKKLSDLKNEFYKTLPNIKKNIYSQLVKDGYFPTNPDNVRNIYYGVGGFILGAMIFTGGAIFAFTSISIGIGIIASAIILLVFAKHMPAKTKKGAETKWP